MTPARAVVKYIRDNLVEAHCGCGDVNRGCADVVFHATAAEEKIDAALAERERATWQAASEQVDAWANKLADLPESSGDVNVEIERLSRALVGASMRKVAAALAQRAEGRGE